MPAYVSRVMEEDRIRSWDIVKVAFETPSSAIFSGGSEVSLELLVFGAIVQALNHPDPSLICVPDQRIADMLVALRNKWGMVGKISGRIYWECWALLHPLISFRHVPASHHIHLDPLASAEKRHVADLSPWRGVLR